METEDYEREYLRDRALIEAEEKARMEAEWEEMEHYAEKKPARIQVITRIKKLFKTKTHETTNDN